MKHTITLFSALLLAPLTALQSAPLAIDLTCEVRAPAASPYGPGTTKDLQGNTLTADTRSFFLNGRPWIPVAGEFHYTHFARAEWRDELLNI